MGYAERDALLGEAAQVLEAGSYDERRLLADKIRVFLNGGSKRKRADVSRGTSLVPINTCVNPGAWDEWQRYRKERNFPPLKEMAQTKLLVWLGSKSPDEQQAIVDQSIRCNYQGLFELKGSSNGQSKYDRLGREFEGKAQSILFMEPAEANVRESVPRSIRDRAERLVDKGSR